jgi:hypothetical protein
MESVMVVGEAAPALYATVWLTLLATGAEDADTVIVKD